MGVLRTVVCLIVPNFPWKFGPYQQNSYDLSLGLHATGQYNVLWLSLMPDEPVARGSYSRLGDLDEQWTTSKTSETPDTGHMTFIGRGTPDQVKSTAGETKISHLNNIADEHRIDVYLMVGDTTQLARDEDFNRNAIIWFPHHYASLTPHEWFVLLAFNGIASLSPTSAAMIDETYARAQERWRNDEASNLGVQYATTPPPSESTQLLRVPMVTCIPHIVRVQRHVDTTGVNVAEGVFATPTRNASAGEDSHVLVLMQAGNYDDADRKGWNAGIQAFAAFHKTRPASHLFVHSISATAIMESARTVRAPSSVRRGGLKLQRLFREFGVPTGSYTLTQDELSEFQVARLKQNADICLLPSKTEGFGMNVLECQVYGTPVITTNFTAMADYTFFGEAVPYDQMEMLQGQGIVPTPSVKGITKALVELSGADRLGDTTRRDVVQKMVQDEFSLKKVSAAFHGFVQDVVSRDLGNRVDGAQKWTFCRRSDLDDSWFPRDPFLWTLVAPTNRTEQSVAIVDNVGLMIRRLPVERVAVVFSAGGAASGDSIFDDTGRIRENCHVLIRTHLITNVPTPGDALTAVPSVGCGAVPSGLVVCRLYHCCSRLTTNLRSPHQRSTF